MGKKRIGILTGGGDVPPLNAVIASAQRTCREEDVELFGFLRGWWGVLENKYVNLGNLDLDPSIGGTILKSSRVRLDRLGGRIEQALRNLHSADIQGLIVVGGEGSLKIALELAQKGVNIIGVPKTIDNDLMETDVTFGFNTALETATDALDKLHTTAESHHRVMIMEVMGRYAGWIALECGIAGGADVILIPEIPFSIDRICQAAQTRRQGGSRFSIIVVAEGAYPLDGNRVVVEGTNETRPVERLGGIGDYVAKKIAGCLDMDVRVTVLGHLQRGGSPSTFDRCLGSRFGIKALDLIGKNDYGKMVSLKGGAITSVEIESAVRKLKLVDPDGEMVGCAEELGIKLGR